MVTPTITLLVNERIVAKLDHTPGYPSDKPAPPKAETISKTTLNTVMFGSVVIRSCSMAQIRKIKMKSQV